MKSFIVLLIIFLSNYIFAQSIIINNGSAIYVPTGADICAGVFGNITGNLIGEGTQCGQSIITTNFQLSVSVSNGWNMVSVPGINPDGQGINNWWINHTGNVFKFVPGSGYSSITTTAPEKVTG